ncbi:hypothetical protein EDB85DRAFT_1898172 [Lactarius pseudohatsudake]|nr:hypothetical protein EDB85DRAFT_1898172 [Lactarius pseudohatsudake]
MTRARRFGGACVFDGAPERCRRLRVAVVIGAVIAEITVMDPSDVVSAEPGSATSAACELGCTRGPASASESAASRACCQRQERRCVAVVVGAIVAGRGPPLLVVSVLAWGCVVAIVVVVVSVVAVGGAHDLELRRGGRGRVVVIVIWLWAAHMAQHLPDPVEEKVPAVLCERRKTNMAHSYSHQSRIERLSGGSGSANEPMTFRRLTLEVRGEGVFGARCRVPAAAASVAVVIAKSVILIVGTLVARGCINGWRTPLLSSSGSGNEIAGRALRLRGQRLQKGYARVVPPLPPHRLTQHKVPRR